MYGIYSFFDLYFLPLCRRGPYSVVVLGPERLEVGRNGLIWYLCSYSCTLFSSMSVKAKNKSIKTMLNKSC